MTSNNSNTNIARVNPLVAEYDGVSPAQVLDLVVGYDGEGWEICQLFAVGGLVISPSGRAYKILAFTLDNGLIVKPYGLDAEPGVRSLLLGSALGLGNLPQPTTGSTSSAA